MKKLLGFILLLFPLWVFSQSFETHFIQDRSSSLGLHSGGGVIDYNDDGALDVIYGSMNRKEFFLLENKGVSYQQKMISDSALSYNRYLKVIDIDMDGDDDYILSPNDGSNFYQLEIYFNQGNGFFTSKKVSTVTFQDIRTLEVFDFDQDGDLDILLDELNNSNYFFLFENDGNFNFTWQWFSLSGQPASLLGVADFDLDGYEDFLGLYFDFSVGNWILFIGENDSTGGFTQQNLDTFGIQPTAVVGDFFGSPHPEFVLSPGSGNTTAFVYENNGSGGFSVVSNLTVPNSATFHLPRDYDNDGDLDFWVYDFNGSFYMRNNGVNSFSASAIAVNPGVIPNYWGDLNGDGSPDLMAQGGSRVQVYHGNGSGQYTLFYENGYGQADHFLLDDINGNGFPDIVLTRLRNYYYFTRDPQGVFLPKRGGQVKANSGTTNQGGIVSIDKENDGDVDALLGFDGDLFWLNNQGGTLTPQFYSKPGSGTPTNLQKGDLDNDANPDIVYQQSSGYELLEKNGATFTLNSTIPGNISKFVLEDIDGDNDGDIVYWSSDFGAMDRSLKFAENNNGSFSTTPTNSNFFSTLSSNYTHLSVKLASGDFDNDQDPDFFVLAPQIDDVLLLRNEGGLVFTDSILFDTLDGATAFQIGDMNLDGNNDIVIGDRNHQRILVYYSDSVGNLTSNTVTKYCGYVDLLEVADMDQDGDLDIVSSSLIDEKLMWFENKVINCPRSFTSLADTICQGGSVQFAGNTLSQPGTYVDSLQNSAGCDSLITLQLNQYPVTSPIQITDKICDGDTVTYNGMDFFQTGMYLDTLQDQNQCEVPFTLDLTVVVPKAPVNLYDTICPGDSILFGGQYYDAPGSYTFTFTNAIGCDTTNILNLAFYSPQQPVIQTTTNTAWISGFTQIQWFKNDTLLPGETGDTLAVGPYGSGNYRIEGQDENGCLSSSPSVFISVVGVSSSFASRWLTLSPNPVSQYLSLHFSQSLSKTFEVRVFTLQGQEVMHFSRSSTGSYQTFDLSSLPGGVYLISVVTEEWEARQKIVKS